MELERASRVLDAERARRLVEIERRGTWAVDGHLSVVSWLAARVRVGFGRASQQVKMSRALRAMPVTSDALGSGELSSEAARSLVSAREAAPEAFSEAEAMLVDAAGLLPVREFRAAIAYWRQAADASAEETRARRVYEGRHLHVSPTIQGTVRIDGDLDPESGQTVLVALRAMQDAWARDGDEDRRTAPQRRADALTELCTSLARSHRPAAGGRRASPRGGDGGPGDPRGEARQAIPARGRRPDHLPNGTAPRVRRGCVSSRGEGRLRAARCGSQDAGRSNRDPACPRDPRRRLSISGLRQASGVVRRSPRRALGRWRRDRAREPRAAVSSTSPSGARGLPGGDDRGAAGVLAARREPARGSGTAVVAPSLAGPPSAVCRRSMPATVTGTRTGPRPACPRSTIEAP